MLLVVQDQPLMAWNCLSHILFFLYLDVVDPHRTYVPSLLEYEWIYAGPAGNKIQ